MKLLIATGIYPPSVGGPATYSKFLFDELPKRGHDVSVLSFDEVRHLPKVVRHAAYFFKLLLKARGRDLIFAQDPVSVGLPALLVSWVTFKKLYIRIAGDYAWEQASQRFAVKDSIDEFQKKRYGLRTEFLRFVQRFVARHAYVVITPSNYFSNLVSDWNKHKKKVYTIYNGIELDPLSKEVPDIRDSLGIPRSQTVIFSAGRLVPWKGFDVLIELVPELVKTYPDFMLVIVGDGPDRKRLQTLANDLGVQRYIFLTGALPRARLLTFLKASNLFVLNTSFESFSFQVVEALYQGVPVVTTNIGNLPEIVDDGLEGILLPPNDKSKLLSAIHLLLSDRGMREAFIARGKRKAHQFSIQATLDNLVQLIQNTL